MAARRCSSNPHGIIKARGKSFGALTLSRQTVGGCRRG